MTSKDDFLLMRQFFDLDGIYNTQNDRIWTVNSEEVDKKLTETVEITKVILIEEIKRCRKKKKKFEQEKI